MQIIVPLQAVAEADQELRGVAHRVGLFHREDLRRIEAGPADRHDERLSQLSHHLSGRYPSGLNTVDDRLRRKIHSQCKIRRNCIRLVSRS